MALAGTNGEPCLLSNTHNNSGSLPHGTTTMQKAHLHLIKWAVKLGYSVAVYGEGEFDGIHHTYKEIKDNVEACDMGEMVLLKPSVKQEGKWKRLASFAYMFDYDQEPDESIFDYGVNEISEAWAAAYAQTEYETA